MHRSADVGFLSAVLGFSAILRGNSMGGSIAKNHFKCELSANQVYFHAFS